MSSNFLFMSFFRKYKKKVVENFSTTFISIKNYLFNKSITPFTSSRVKV